VPVTPHRPCAERDNGVLPVQNDRIRGAEAAGVKPPWVFKIF